MQVRSNNAQGEVVFDAISYTTEGIYNYTINEVKGSLPNVTYDMHVAKASVRVVKDQTTGELIATATYDGDTPPTFSCWW